MNPRYWETREKLQRKLSRPGVGRRLVRLGTRVKDSFKHLVVPGMVFEELGIVSVGPIDGHDIGLVTAAVKAAREMDGPVLIHAVTRKGKGYEPAESNPALFHGIGAFDPATGKTPARKPNAAPTYTEVFARALIAEAAQNPDIVAITAAMPAGTGLDIFQKAYPKRFIDVGIAEGHAVGLAAGLAFGGRLPVFAVYSTFLQRGYDQMIGDVALQGAHVVFALDRAGFVGDDGPTHAGLYDLTYLRSIPTMRILAPSDEAELVDALHTALLLDGPVALRYPRGAAVGATVPDEPTSWEVGRAAQRRASEGGQVALLAVGHMLGRAEAAAELLSQRGVEASVWDMRWVKPIDEDCIRAEAENGKLLVTIEENTIRGGFGSAVAEYLSAAGIVAPLLQLAVPDEFSVQGPIDTLLDKAGLAPAEIADRVAERLSREGGTHGAQEAR